jgi:hypothetical protein
MTKTIATFRSTRNVIKAEKLCRALNINCKVIPVPRGISSECGMALEIAPQDEDSAKAAFLNENLEVNFVRIGV